jgi:hypothetical protein
MFAAYKDSDASLLIRTDFSDDSAWQALCDLVQQPQTDEGFQAFFSCIDDVVLAGMSLEDLALHAANDLHCSAIFIADAVAMNSPEHAVLCVDCSDRQGASFRVIPSEIWGPENNLRLGNMDFIEFAKAAEINGVFRGFSV